jgi:hypothetical protein
MIRKYAHDSQREQRFQEGKSRESLWNDTRNCRAFLNDHSSQCCCSQHQVFEDAPVSQGPEEPAGMVTGMSLQQRKNDFFELKFATVGSEKHVALRQKVPIGPEFSGSVNRKSYV